MMILKENSNSFPLRLVHHSSIAAMMISLVFTSSLLCLSAGEERSTLPGDYDAISRLLSGLGAEVPIGDPCGTPRWPGVTCLPVGVTYAIADIDRSNARLTGSIGSDVIGNFHFLNSLNLSHNEIGGGFPSVLPPSLLSLSVSHNNLSGPIPDSLDDLTALLTLDISGNFLSGPLPLSLGSMHMLTTLYMQDNKLSGSLETLKNLTSLTTLNIQNNLFTGQVPDEILDGKNFSCIGCPTVTRKKGHFLLILVVSSVIIFLGVVSRVIYNNRHSPMAPELHNRVHAGAEIEIGPL